MDGATVPLRATVSSVPPAGVFFTVKALLARLAAAARSSVKVMTSDAPSTVAELAVGVLLFTTSL